ncbi:MAG: zinc-binding dehydrogenase [Lachnospiraceae bacterium]|nr:zinc-binding dehydrogenase [Lachnospiraceae bacterium]
MKIFISGAGIQALAILQQLRYRYKDLDISISDFSEYRLGLAKKFGADHIINLNEVKDPFQYLADIWGTTKIPYWVGDRDSGNADIVYECSGSTAGYELAFDVVKPKGKICCIGITKGNISIHPNYFLLKEVVPLGGLTGNPMLSVADVRAGVLSPIDYISRVFPLEELDKAFQVAMNPKVSMKVVVKVDPTAPDYPYNAVAYEQFKKRRRKQIWEKE